jgi:hypothetical protein
MLCPLSAKHSNQSAGKMMSEKEVIFPGALMIWEFKCKQGSNMRNYGFVHLFRTDTIKVCQKI